MKKPSWVEGCTKYRNTHYVQHKIKSEQKSIFHIFHMEVWLKVTWSQLECRLLAYWEHTVLMAYLATTTVVLSVTCVNNLISDKIVKI